MNLRTLRKALSGCQSWPPLRAQLAERSAFTSYQAWSWTSASLCMVLLLLRILTLNQAPHCGSEISVNVFVFNTSVCILYPTCQIRILGSGNPVFVYYQAPWLIQSLSQGGEVLFQTNISLRWSGVSRSLIWESGDQELSHDPSTKGAQKKEGD